MRRLGVIALWVWLGVGIVVGGLLLLRHVGAMPAPIKSDVRLRDAIAAWLPDHTGRWRVVHIMYRSCQCSRRTIEHLTTTPRPAGLDELVLMVDDDGHPGADDARLSSAGFRVEVITPAVLHERFHIEAAPVLVVARPDHELAYVGGSNRAKQSPAYEDIAIIAAAVRRGAPAPLPVFGCATSDRLARRFDPLGLRKW
jgi:hypothetical protein